MRRRIQFLTGCLGLLSAAPPAPSATPPADPPLKALRFEEDYRALRDRSLHRDAFDRVKALPMPFASEGHLTIGGELRLRYEYLDNAQWGQGPQDGNGYWLQRYMLHADAHVGENLRGFVQLKSGVEGGRTGGPRPPDEDQLDLHQAFLDLPAPTESGASFTLRVGRQELAYGSSRLISFREGPNVRLSFDSVRGIWKRGGWRVDTFAAAPVQTKAGTFDDASEPGQRLWGLYAVGPFPALPGGNIDLYYLGLRRDAARFAQGIAREERHSFGTRLWGKHAAWDYNAELVVQTGEFGDGAIRAWTVATDTGRTFAALPWSPRFGLKANIASGDRDPQQDRLETFNPLFPRGAYFSESGLIGPSNFMDVHPSVTVNPTERLALTVDADFFWRQSTSDGLYGPAVNLLRPGSTSTARRIGTQTSIVAVWRPGRHWAVTAAYAHFFAGAFLRESGPDRDVDYATAQFSFTF